MNKLIYFVVICLSVIAFQTNAQESIFRGFIHEKSSGEVIPFQKIKIYSSTNEFSGAVTDVNGFFSIPKLHTGKYAVIIESTIYEALQDSIEIVASTPIFQKKYELIKEIKTNIKILRSKISMSKNRINLRIQNT